MSLFLFGAIVAILGVIGGVYLGGYMSEREGRKETEKLTTPPAQAANASAAQPTEKRRLWFASSKQPDQALRFQSWASANFQNAELRTWIASLSPEQARALTEQLATFCTNLGFDLDWLTGKRLVSNPTLEPMATVIVEHYCTACFQATTVQGDFQRFKKALEVVDQPFSREHKPIAQKLYAELVRREIAPPMPPELMVASEQARQEYITRVLKDVSANNWPAFMNAFQEASRADSVAKAKTDWSNTLRHPFRQHKAATPIVNIYDQATATKE